MLREIKSLGMFSLLYIITALLLSNNVGASVKTNSQQVKIQDANRAVEFFESELNFKTTPYGALKVVNKEIQNVTIVDVRTAKDYAAGHIPGAVNIPYDEYENFEGKKNAFPGLRKDGFNYVYCYQHLCNLGQKAAKQFAEAGYPVKELVGGYKSWLENGYPIEK